mgnify:CR=1 FL=1
MNHSSKTTTPSSPLSSKIFFTISLVVINVGIFIGMNLTGEPDTVQFLRFGGQFGPALWEGEAWRLLTPVFLHADIFHLLFNCYALYVLGWMVEPVLGGKRFLWLYLFSGIFGSLLSVNMSPHHVSVGASGAIFGVAGAALAGRFLVSGNLKNIFSEPLSLLLILFVGYNVLIGLIQPSVDNAAHIGGLIAGSIFGYYLMAQRLGAVSRLRVARIIYILFSLFFITLTVYSLNPVFSPEWRLWHARRLDQTGKEKEAEDDYRKAVKVSGGAAEYRRELGAFLIRTGDAAGALKEYEAALEETRDKGELYFLMGAAHLALDQSSKVPEYYRKALYEGYFGSQTLVLQATAYARMEDNSRALKAYLRALDMDPTSKIAWQAILYFLTAPEKEKDEDEIKNIRKTISGSDFNSARIMLNSFLGAYYRHFRDFEKSVQYYHEAIKADSNPLFLYYDLALSQFKNGELEEAERSLNQFLGVIPSGDYAGLRAPRNIALMLNLKIAEKRDNEDDVKRLEKQIEKNYRSELNDERTAIYLNNLAWHLADRGYKLNEAVTLAKEAVEKDYSAYTLDTLAWAYTRSGYFKKALEIQKKAMEQIEKQRNSRIARLLTGGYVETLQPDEGRRMYLYHLAVIYEGLGEKGKAKSLFMDILKQGVDFEEYEAAAEKFRSLRDSQNSSR